MAATHAETVVDRTRKCLEIAILDVATPIKIDTNARAAPPWPVIPSHSTHAGGSNVALAGPIRCGVFSGDSWVSLGMAKF
jgi:hypothetical protein